MRQEIPVYIGLIAAVIGACAALISQYFASYLTAKRECKKLKRELLAEERCQAYLLSEYYIIFIDDLISSQFYLKLAALSFKQNDSVDNEKLYKSGNEALESAGQTEEKIRLATANYFKIITHFTNITGKREKIINLFNQLKKFQKTPVANFNECKNLRELQEVDKMEKVRFREIYNFFPESYTKIFEEMKKSL